jgi:hypothetical protein
MAGLPPTGDRWRRSKAFFVSHLTLVLWNKKEPAEAGSLDFRQTPSDTAWGSVAGPGN